MRILAFTLLASAALVAACDPPSGGPAPPRPEPGEELLGGDTTVFDVSRDAFTKPAPNLDADQREEFDLGDHFFNRNWVTAPASAEGTDGLGPLYNATSCSACHFKDGRGRPPEGPDEDYASVLFRLSVPGADARGAPLPEPFYGDQLQNHAILGLEPEARPIVDWETFTVEYLDGTLEELRMPHYTFEDMAYGPFEDDTMVSPRVARQLVGLGLVQAIEEDDILANADPEDADGDGISGRPNWVWDDERGEMRVGRFGWKAGEPSVRQQNARAFVEDIGITSPIYGVPPCMPSQTSCMDAASGGDPEIDESKFDRISFYMHTIGVPARRDYADEEVLRGRELFRSAGCNGCHLERMTTGNLEGFAMLSNQLVRPYSDFLLHDMGELLADGRPDHEADGQEWRTPPLWGIGLVETVNRHHYLLHDGRAEGFAQAILWHGGEAFDAREAFRVMDRSDRDALVRFLESL